MQDIRRKTRRRCSAEEKIRIVLEGLRGEERIATLEWVDWFNMRRLLGPIGDVPPAEFEAQYYEQAKVA